MITAFPILSPSGQHIVRGSGVLSIDGDDARPIPAQGWAKAWLDDDTIVFNGAASISAYSRVTGKLTELWGRGCHAVAAGGGVWMGTGNGSFLRRVDGTVAPGPYYDPCVESASSFAYGKVQNGHKALFWNDVLMDGRGVFYPCLQDGLLTWQTIGMYGMETWCADSPSAIPVRVSPAGRQYSSRAVMIGATRYILATDEGRLFLYKPGQTNGIMIATGITKDPVCRWVGDRLRIAWWGSHPNERQMTMPQPTIELSDPPPPPPVIPTIGRPIWVWYCKAWSNGGADAGPDYPAYAGLPGYAAEVEFQHQLDESKPSFILPHVTLLDSLKTHRSRIVAILCHAGNVADLKAQGKSARKRFPRIPTLGICDFKVPPVQKIAGITDIAYEVYPSGTETLAQTEARLATAIAASPYHRIHLIQIAYDMNGLIDYAHLLAHQAVAARLAVRFPHKVTGIGIFAANRANGLRKYPELLAFHRQMTDGVPGHPKLIRT